MESHLLSFEHQNSFSEIELNLNIMEMPYKFFENSFWMRGMFAEASRNGVGVLLNGGRGNLTISWGAALDYYAILLKRMRWFKLLQELQHFSHRTRGARLKRIPMIAKRAFPITYKKNTNDYPTLINENFAKKTKVYQKLKSYGIDESGWFASQNVFKQRARHFQDLFHWNASNTWSAKLSLPYSVWKRDATNDLRVIQFCLSLPEDQYVMKGLDRALIRRATEGLLPDKVRLNQQTRGVQGADWVHRMLPHWPDFINESKKLLSNERLLMYVNREELETAIQKVEKGVDASFVTDPSSKVLMRSMVLAKFLDKF
ncbi:asparagine synthase [Bacillus sp. TS-2]|nr:asparagine synthase [Bacillus sp. TS-2]